MRKGQNTSKESKLNLKLSSHRVIIPLYIPIESDYYKESFEIFRMCLESLHKTSYSSLKISVVSNGSCNSINSKLLAMQQQELIDELIIESEAIGKINSILKALRTVEERFVTITDGDVLFLNHWEDKTLQLFDTFPNAGMVSPVPIFRTHFRLTSNIWIRHLLSKRLYFRAVKNQDALTKFAASIGWPRLDEKWKDTILTLQGKNDVLAVVGCSHFVGTYKREVFKYLPKVNSDYRLGGDSELLYTDLPVVKAGGYRLATYDNYAYHMGNTIEPWMIEVFEAIKVKKEKQLITTDYTLLRKKNWLFLSGTKVFEKLLHIKLIKKKLLRYKGLTNKQLQNFIS